MVIHISQQYFTMIFDSSIYQQSYKLDFGSWVSHVKFDILPHIKEFTTDQLSLIISKFDSNRSSCKAPLIASLYCAFLCFHSGSYKNAIQLTTDALNDFRLYNKPEWIKERLEALQLLCRLYQNPEQTSLIKFITSYSNSEDPLTLYILLWNSYKIGQLCKSKSEPVFRLKFDHALKTFNQHCFDIIRILNMNNADKIDNHTLFENDELLKRVEDLRIKMLEIEKTLPGTQLEQVEEKIEIIDLDQSDSFDSDDEDEAVNSYHHHRTISSFNAIRLSDESIPSFWKDSVSKDHLSTMSMKIQSHESTITDLRSEIIHLNSTVECQQTKICVLESRLQLIRQHLKS